MELVRDVFLLSTAFSISCAAPRPPAANSTAPEASSPPPTTAAATPSPTAAAAAAAQPVAAASASAPAAGSASVSAPETPPDQATNYFHLKFVEESPSKYKVEGPWNIGDPVHETITRRAVDRSAWKSATAPGQITDLLRGIFWNDDPCRQLFDDQALDMSNGLAWYQDFSKAEKLANAGKSFSELQCTLLGRSHFGDLQFLHGMANADGIPASETLAAMLAWAKFTYLIATGVEDPTKPMKTDHPELARTIRVPDDGSAMQLFLGPKIQNRSAVQEWALGSLLHMLQDSYAAGHAERKEVGGRRRQIMQFYSYARQDHGRHAEDDAWSLRGTPDEMVAAIKGGRDALEVSTETLKHAKARATWETYRAYLVRGPLALDPNAKPSGPGTAYQQP